MDDPLALVMFGLFGVLGVFLIVRLVKHASHTVDEEQGNKQHTSYWEDKCPKCGAKNSPLAKYCRVCGVPAPMLDPTNPVSQSPSGQVAEGQTGIPKEVRLGMTPIEVQRVLGVPHTKADLGTKVLFKYKDLTVEFHEGKVADVR